MQKRSRHNGRVPEDVREATQRKQRAAPYLSLCALGEDWTNAPYAFIVRQLCTHMLSHMYVGISASIAFAMCTSRVGWNFHPPQWLLSPCCRESRYLHGHLSMLDARMYGMCIPSVYHSIPARSGSVQMIYTLLLIYLPAAESGVGCRCENSRYNRSIHYIALVTWRPPAPGERKRGGRSIAGVGTTQSNSSADGL